MTADGDMVIPGWLPLNVQELPQTCHTGDDLGDFARTWGQGQGQQDPENHSATYGPPTTTADLGIRIIGKRPRRSKSPEKRREIAAKRNRGEQLTLDENRSEEAEAVKVVLKKH